jgi:hypothetical protein
MTRPSLRIPAERGLVVLGIGLGLWLAPDYLRASREVARWPAFELAVQAGLFLTFFLVRRIPDGTTRQRAELLLGTLGLLAFVGPLGWRPEALALAAIWAIEVLLRWPRRGAVEGAAGA